MPRETYPDEDRSMTPEEQDLLDELDDFDPEYDMWADDDDD